MYRGQRGAGLGVRLLSYAVLGERLRLAQWVGVVLVVLGVVLLLSGPAGHVAEE